MDPGGTTDVGDSPLGGARISIELPLTSAVELVRPMFLDQWPAHPLRGALVLAGYAVVSYWAALALTRRRFQA